MQTRRAGYPPFGTGSDLGHAVTIQPDGKIVIAGTAANPSDDFGVVRYEGDATTPLRTPFDFDGDGKTDISIFRPSAGEWWYSKSSNDQVFAIQFGSSADKPVPADFTGDGKADITFWRESSGEWFVLRSEDSSYYAFPFGASGDLPAPGDYDGDGKMDAAVFRPANSVWYLLRSTSGFGAAAFGTSGDTPLPGVFVR